MSKSDSTLTIRMNNELKKQAQILFSSLGMNLTTAINIFIKQALQTKGFPFEISDEVPNETTIAAFEEGEKLLADPASKRYSSIEELFNDLDSDEI